MTLIKNVQILKKMMSSLTPQDLLLKIDIWKN